MLQLSLVLAPAPIPVCCCRRFRENLLSPSNSLILVRAVSMLVLRPETSPANGDNMERRRNISSDCCSPDRTWKSSTGRTVSIITSSPTTCPPGPVMFPNSDLGVDLASKLSRDSMDARGGPLLAKLAPPPLPYELVILGTEIHH